MRKFRVLFCSIIMALTFLATCFCAVIKPKNVNFASAKIEDEYYTAQSIDLISRTPSSNISTGVIENVAPFDTDTKTKMEGSSITPSSDEYGQVKNKEFKINDYSPITGDVIYLWIYLIDALGFKLEISLTDKLSSTVKWEFNSMQVSDMKTGWKLIALSLADFEEEQDYNLITYSYIVFNYIVDGEENEYEYDAKTNERFSFYHIFATNQDGNIQVTGMVYNQGLSFYEFSKDFSFGGTVFVGDKIKIQSANEIFDYLYIGKYSLEDYSTSGKYYWVLSIENPDMVKTYVDFGDNILFLKTGYHNLNIKLYEVGISSNTIVLNKDISIFCDEAKLGNFSTGARYKMKDNESILLSLNISENLNLQEEYEITLTNNKAEIDTYYEENGVLYVCVSGVSGGEVTLDISAKGTTKFNDSVKTFTASATLEIESTEKKVDVFLVIIWITFACFCVGILIYLAISLVKARKNDVK